MTTQRLTIPEAAKQLGISEVTVRRRIKSDELQAEKEKTKQGHRWLIIMESPVNEPEAADQITDQEVITATQSYDQRLVDELNNRISLLEDQLGNAQGRLDWSQSEMSELRAEITEQRIEAAEQRKRADTLQAMNQTAQDRIRELEALQPRTIADDRQRGTHGLVGASRSNATSAGGLVHDDDDQRGGGGVWHRVMRVLRGA